MTRYSKMIRTMRKNYTYDLDQLHKMFGVHPQTIRGWIKRTENPLKCLHRNPTYIFSEDLRVILKQEDQKRKTPLEPTQMFCMSCKKGRNPLNNSVHFHCRGKSINLKGICPECRSLMNKQTSSKTLNLTAPMYKKITREELDILRFNNQLDTTQNIALNELDEVTFLRPYDKK